MPDDSSKPTLSVVMPAYNEEHSIQSVIEEHLSVLAQIPEASAWEIVCVDDASQDATAATLAQLRDRIPRLIVERHAVNQGIYGSFRDGYLRAQGRYIYATGSDGQWPAENLLLLFDALRRGADLVVGVRSNRQAVYTPARRVISFLFNYLSRLLFRVPVRDAGSVKLGIREIFTADLLSRSVFVEAERIIHAQRAGYKVEFVPIEFRPRLGGKATGARITNVLSASLDLLRCLVHYR